MKMCNEPITNSLRIEVCVFFKDGVLLFLLRVGVLSGQTLSLSLLLCNTFPCCLRAAVLLEASRYLPTPSATFSALDACSSCWFMRSQRIIYGAKWSKRRHRDNTCSIAGGGSQTQRVPRLEIVFPNGVFRIPDLDL